MSFYEELSQVYDIVFPEDKETTDFLCSELKENSKVLDLACGSGSYSIALEAKGHNVTGIDLDASMIELAKNKDKNNKVKFLAANMLSLDQLFKGTKFDLIYCIGNSLVHLENKQQISSLLNQVYEKLDTNGQFVVQIINYDRILKNAVKNLPTINRDDKGVKFVRNYNYNKLDGKMYFDTELIINKDGTEEKYNNSVPLLPLKSAELIELFNNAGFPKLDVLGDFSDEKFNEASYALVIKAYKL